MPVATTKNVSEHCAKGRHSRCLGTVMVFPPVDGKRIIPCQCSAPDCPHVQRAAAVSPK